jgi:soluble lytic murein transglycosylase-like protein/TolA-binding protein
VIQSALFHRAKLAIREGCSKDYALFQKDLQQILKDFPRGRLADSALYQLASYHLDRYRDLEDPQDLQIALELFAQLRKNYPYREAHIDSSWFKPALALYTRGDPKELQQAATLLHELEKARPNGPLHLAALFWLGRIAAETGQDQEARGYFEAIIGEFPYDYYATRARMHLHVGNQAARQFSPDLQTTEELKANFQHSQDQRPPLTEKSPYHVRLQAALHSGLYYRSLRSYIDFRNKEFPASRLESIPLERLDQGNRLTHVALLLALRQDALAATDTPPDPRNRLAVANTLSKFKSPSWPFGDWPLVVYISGAVDRPYEVKSKIQTDPGFLAVAYPKTFGPLIGRYSGPDLPGAFLYAVIRHESAFETTALSPAGALGLFQFTPRTFNVLDKRYHVLRIRGTKSREEFLLNPDDSIYLGALWFRKELLPSQGHNLLWALMEHNAGNPAVEEWKSKWRRWGRIGDYEFMIDSVRFGETRAFVRRVVNAYWIVQAAGLY